MANASPQTSLPPPPMQHQQQPKGRLHDVVYPQLSAKFYPSPSQLLKNNISPKLTNDNLASTSQATVINKSSSIISPYEIEDNKFNEMLLNHNPSKDNNSSSNSCGELYNENENTNINSKLHGKDDETASKNHKKMVTFVINDLNNNFLEKKKNNQKIISEKNEGQISSQANQQKKQIRCSKTSSSDFRKNNNNNISLNLHIKPSASAIINSNFGVQQQNAQRKTSKGFSQGRFLNISSNSQNLLNKKENENQQGKSTQQFECMSKRAPVVSLIIENRI